MTAERIYSSDLLLPQEWTLSSVLEFDRFLLHQGLEAERVELEDDAGEIRGANLTEALEHVGRNEINSIHLFYRQSPDVVVQVYWWDTSEGAIPEMQIRSSDHEVNTQLRERVEQHFDLQGNRSSRSDSTRNLTRPLEDSAPDHPSRWLEPITAEEYGSIESLVTALQRLLDEADGLSADERSRVQGAIELLSDAHRTAEVGVTQRIEMLATVKAVVRYVAIRLPRSLVLWDHAVGVLSRWYPSVAEALRSLLS